MEKNPGASGEPPKNLLCQRCQTRPASVHFSQVINGDKSDRYLCEDCAKEEGAFHFMIGPQFTVQHVLGGLIGQPTGQARQESVARRCPYCGYTYQRFAETGRLGCDRCYETFHAELEPLVRRLHGSVEHHGKIPQRGGRHLIQRQALAELRERMKAAVAQENFEEAAELRDRIRELEETADGGERGARDTGI